MCVCIISDHLLWYFVVNYISKHSLATVYIYSKYTYNIVNKWITFLSVIICRSVISCCVLFSRSWIKKSKQGFHATHFTSVIWHISDWNRIFNKWFYTWGTHLKGSYDVTNKNIILCIRCNPMCYAIKGSNDTLFSTYCTLLLLLYALPS